MYICSKCGAELHAENPIICMRCGTAFRKEDKKENKEEVRPYIKTDRPMLYTLRVTFCGQSAVNSVVKAITEHTGIKAEVVRPMMDFLPIDITDLSEDTMEKLKDGIESAGGVPEIVESEIASYYDPANPIAVSIKPVSKARDQSALLVLLRKKAAECPKIRLVSLKNHGIVVSGDAYEYALRIDGKSFEMTAYAKWLTYMIAYGAAFVVGFIMEIIVFHWKSTRAEFIALESVFLISNAVIFILFKLENKEVIGFLNRTLDCRFKVNYFPFILFFLLSLIFGPFFVSDVADIPNWIPEFIEEVKEKGLTDYIGERL